MNMHTRPSVMTARIALLACVSLWPAASFAQDAANSPPAKKPLDASQATAVLDPGLEADLLLLSFPALVKKIVDSKNKKFCYQW